MATVAVPTATCKALIDDLYGTSAPAGEPLAATEPLPEAAFSLTIKGWIGGNEAMLTVRGQSAAAFRANVQAVSSLLDTQPTPAPQAQTTAPTPAAPAETPEGWCAVHSVQMPLQTNARGSWRSHKTADGTWCKGK